MKDFAGKSRPIRASNLPKLMQCVKGFVLATYNTDDDAGEPAQTGSLIHLGIQTYHESKGNKNLAMVSLRQGQKEYPLANIERAGEHVTNYINREKIDPKGEVIYSERKETIILKPAAFDTTKKEIVINGTVDQIRKLGDWYYVIDFKTGFKPGEEMVRYYTPQLAAYCVAASKILKTDKIKTFIGRTEDLKNTRYPYYWPMPFTVADALLILDDVRSLVAMIRMGGMSHNPGKHCEYCPAEWHYPNCKLEKGQKRADMISLPTVAKRNPIKSVSELFYG